MKGILIPEVPETEGTPTVVLVHGAFADASSWNGVVERLLERSVKVTAPANPLRGIASDSAYAASLFEQTPGPVLAVGHSYGGAVITNAASRATNVLGLVYVAAFAPEEGETLGDVEDNSKDSVLNSALIQLRYPVANGGTAVEFAIDPAKFHDAFAADLALEQTALMAATQRPAAEAAFSEPSGPPAWKRLPSWTVLATGDTAAGTDVIRGSTPRSSKGRIRTGRSPVASVTTSRRRPRGRSSTPSARSVTRATSGEVEKAVRGSPLGGSAPRDRAKAFRDQQRRNYPCPRRTGCSPSQARRRMSPASTVSASRPATTVRSGLTAWPTTSR